MTDITIDQPPYSETNSATYNRYYKDIYGKGGVFTKLCGWEGSRKLYTSGIGDSNYVQYSTILEE